MKKVIITTTIGVFIFIVGFLLFTADPNKIEEAEQNICQPYPTGVYVDDFTWMNEKEIMFLKDKNIKTLDIESLRIQNITTFEVENIGQISNYVKVGNNNYCITYIFEISEPDQIASLIKIFDLKTNKLVVKKKSSLSLKVDQCENPLLLSQAYPFLEEKQYNWKFSTHIPYESKVINSWTIENKDDNIKIIHQNKLICEFPSVADFKNLQPNVEENKIALTDDNEELWIITISK